MHKQSIAGNEGARLSAKEFAESHYKTPAFVEHAIRCGKPNCKCATSDYRHGPYSYLYWRDGAGQPRRRYVRKEEADDVREVVQLRQAIDRERRQVLAASVTYLRDLRTRMRELKRIGQDQGLW